MKVWPFRLNCVQLSKASSLYKALRTTNRQYLEARHPCHACTRAGIYVTWRLCSHERSPSEPLYQKYAIELQSREYADPHRLVYNDYVFWFRTYSTPNGVHVIFSLLTPHAQQDFHCIGIHRFITHQSFGCCMALIAFMDYSRILNGTLSLLIRSH